MPDAISITAIILSSITALAGAVAGIHIRKFHSGCLECECFETNEQRQQRRKSQSPPITPIIKELKNPNFTNV